MPTIPCPTNIACLPCNDSPVLNISSESPDVDRYLARFSFLNSIPPIRQYPDFDEQGGGIFLQVGCMRWCWSTISQDDADLCAQRQAIECAFNPLIPGIPIPTPFSPNRIALYYNDSVTGTSVCPDGNAFTYTIPANQIAATTQGHANAIAASLAKTRARQHRICISDMDDPICVDTWATKQITASGPNVAVFPATDRWELVSGTIPPGMTLETGFTSDGIQFSGIPTTIGEYSFRVRVTISTFGSPGLGDFAEKTFTVKIVGINESSPLPDAGLGTPYTQQLTAAFSTDVAGEAWSVVSGNLPDGLTMDEHGLISGTPTGALAGYSFTAQVFYFVGGNKALCTKNLTITTSPSIPTPIAFWKMDEASGNRVDQINGLLLVPQFGVPVNGVPGKLGNAAEFINSGFPFTDLATDSPFERPELKNLGTGFTVAGWCQITDAFQVPFLITFRDSLLNYLGNMVIDMNGGGNAIRVWGTDSNANAYSVAQTDTPPTPGDWVFFRAWFDPLDTKVKIQVNNGTIAETGAGFAYVASDNGSLDIFPDTSFNPGLIMLVDELGIFMPPLTDAEADQLYNAGSGRTCCPFS